MELIVSYTKPATASRLLDMLRGEHEGGPSALRRARALARGQRASRSWRRIAVATGSAAGCLGTGVALVLVGSVAPMVGFQVAQVLGVIAAGLFLGSGVLRIARWRLDHERKGLVLGAALIMLGGLGLPLTSLARLMVGSSESSSLVRVATGVTTALVLLLLIGRRLSGWPAGRRTPGTRSGLIACLGIVALGAALLVVHVSASVLLASGAVPSPVLGALLVGIAWFGLGIDARSLGTRSVWAGRVLPVLGGLAIFELLRFVDLIDRGAWEVVGAVFVLCVSALTAHRSLSDLDQVTQADHENLEVVSEALTRSRAGVTQQRAWREELVHDATNALTGLRAALHTLEQYGTKLDAATQHRLREAVLGEVSHLEHLILRQDAEATVDFDLSAVVSTVVQGRRAAGLEVSLRGPSMVRAHGRPGDLATVLQNLLVNVQEHAHGPAEVELSHAGSRVQIRVRDDGPGVPDDRVEKLFERGARGPDSRGSGLGLHVARTLMRQQGGDLRLLTHRGGCTFAVLLPAAAEGADGSAVPVQRQQEGIAATGRHREGQPDADESEASAAGR